MIFGKLMALLVMMMVVVACSGTGSNNIAAITPLPTQDVAAAPTATLAPVSVANVSSPDPQVAVNPEIDDENTSDTDFSDPLASNNSANLGAYPTPVIEFAGLEPGVARDWARATDIAMSPDLEDPMTFADSDLPMQITFSEFYDGYDMRTGLQRSRFLDSLDGMPVVMEGYVAPPLKPFMDFFVLTRVQLAYCPFCSTDTEWPDDIALVYLPEPDLISSAYPVRVTGTLEVGSSIDAETGMVSLVRIYAEDIETLD